MSAREEAVARLRGAGLRATAQRQAILRAFSGERTEHLSADEVHERARGELADLGRATVYSTLSDLARAGLIDVLGRPEPVRYELRTAPHQHFRCLACGRSYDVSPRSRRPLALAEEGFVVERIRVEFEGTCAQCGELERALRTAGREDVPREAGGAPTPIAWAAVESPLGVLLAAASDRGLVCVAYDGERPEPILHDLAARLSAELVEAPERLEEPRRQIDAFLGGRRREFDLPLDLASIGARHRAALRSVTQVPYGRTVAYRSVTDAVAGEQAGEVAGQALGANPLAIVVPCHRVLRADGGIGAYVGGVERKRRLLELERTVA